MNPLLVTQLDRHRCHCLLRSCTCGLGRGRRAWPGCRRGTRSSSGRLAPDRNGMDCTSPLPLSQYYENIRPKNRTPVSGVYMLMRTHTQTASGCRNLGGNCHLLTTVQVKFVHEVKSLPQTGHRHPERQGKGRPPHFHSICSARKPRGHPCTGRGWLDTDTFWVQNLGERIIISPQTLST